MKNLFRIGFLGLCLLALSPLTASAASRELRLYYGEYWEGMGTWFAVLHDTEKDPVYHVVSASPSAVRKLTATGARILRCRADYSAVGAFRYEVTINSIESCQAITRKELYKRR